MSSSPPSSLDAAYRDFVAQHPRAQVWHDADFLGALGAGLSHGHWSYVNWTEAGELVGVLPYFRRQRFGISSITVPPLARYADPLFAPHVVARQGVMSCVEQVLERLPRGMASVDLAWSPDVVADVSPTLILAGLQVSLHPTYRLRLPPTAAELPSLFSSSTRKRYLRAQRQLQLKRGPLSQEGLDLLSTPYERQELSQPYDDRVLRAAFEHLRQQGHAIAHEAYDVDGQLLAASILLLDQQGAYSWVSGSSDAGRKHAAGSYLFAEEMRTAQERGHYNYDFLGSALPGPAANRRSLGGHLTHYVTWHREAGWWNGLQALRQRPKRP